MLKHCYVFVDILALSFLVNAASIPQAGYQSPLDSGGSMLTFVTDTFPAGLGEPINVIISANSDPAVLVDSTNNGGLQNYFLSFGYTTECLGQHLGDHQAADLGDGSGQRNETAVIRYDYGNPYTGTCTESVNGGGHFRYWIQNGPNANTGAIFMAVSSESPSSQGHDIILNGYDLGRDWLLGNATNQTTLIPTLDLAVPTPSFTNYTTNITTPASSGFLPQISGDSTYGNYTYHTVSTYTTGLLSNTSIGINHNGSVAVDGRPAIDGLVAVLEVHITKTPNSKTSDSGAVIVRRDYVLAPLLLLIVSLL